MLFLQQSTGVKSPYFNCQWVLSGHPSSITEKNHWRKNSTKSRESIILLLKKSKKKLVFSFTIGPGLFDNPCLPKRTKFILIWFYTVPLNVVQELSLFLKGVIFIYFLTFHHVARYVLLPVINFKLILKYWFKKSLFVGQKVLFF